MVIWCLIITPHCIHILIDVLLSYAHNKINVLLYLQRNNNIVYLNLSWNGFANDGAIIIGMYYLKVYFSLI